jgi:SagB-type dehydrogenase family enzyme
MSDGGVGGRGLVPLSPIPPSHIAPSPHPIYAYHDGTKHQFNRFARSLGYLDWAAQPAPFRSYAGAREIALAPRPDAPESALRTPHSAIGVILRHSLGLSAWKQFGQSRWSLRVNPSSGNLHPTEAYVIDSSGVYHYAADRHALEERCAFPTGALPGDVVLVALTSIHWREAWKYGERAFRYCQHDLGHAIAAVSIAAATFGFRARLLADWSHADIASLTGIDRDEDFVDAEREEAGCVLVVSRESVVGSRAESVVGSPGPVLAAVRGGTWTGRASQLSEEHVQWTFIDEIAAATRDPGRSVPQSSTQFPDHPIPQLPDPALLLQRRSAVALDGRSTLGAERFLAMMSAVLPAAAPPWNALWWDARIHLALFVHRVDDLDPGVYLLPRNPRAIDRLKASMGREFLWERVTDASALVCLARGDCRRLAQRVSCDQEIAGDGFFSLGMLAEFDAALDEFGPSFYRHLFWESGLVGQALYLEAEAAGARGTGIGCFYDDPVHDLFGLTGHAFQSLYHFTIGMPVEDPRLTTEAGYSWESAREWHR